jgi:hypothetical protein
VSILNSMQKAHQETKIGPVIKNSGAKHILRAKEVPINKGKLKQYLVIPVKVIHGIFMGEIYIHSNHTIQEYKANSEFT